MSLNMDAIKDFRTLLCTIPFNMLKIEDFYHSIRSFYMGIMAHLVKKHGMNNLFILNIVQAFDNFILTCDYLEELPDGKVQFKGMMTSMIRDVYNIDWEELMGATQEIR